MSFVKDDHSFTRGVGAVAAMDASSPRRRAAAAQAARKMARRDRIMSMRTLGALSFPTGPSTGVAGPHSIDVGWTGQGSGGLQTPTGPRGGGGGSSGGGSPGRGHGPRGGTRGTSGGIMTPGGYQPRQPPGTKMPGSVVTTTPDGTTTQTSGGNTTSIGPTGGSSGSGGGGPAGGDSGSGDQAILECNSRGAPWYWDGSVCNQEATVTPPVSAAPTDNKKLLLYGALGAGVIWYFFLRGK